MFPSERTISVEILMKNPEEVTPKVRPAGKCSRSCLPPDGCMSPIDICPCASSGNFGWPVGSQPELPLLCANL